MSIDSDARVRELLRIADDAWRMLAAGHAPPGLAEALEGVYRDLGKHIHQRHRDELLRPAVDAAETQEIPARAPWPRSDGAPPLSMAATPSIPDIAPPAELEPPPTVSRSVPPLNPYDDDDAFDPAALPIPEGPADDGEDARWYTEEVEIDAEAMFRPEDALPAPLPMSDEPEPTTDDAPAPVSAPASAPVPQPEATSPTLAPVNGEAPWLAALRRLLDLAGPPPPLDTTADAAVELSRLEWAVGAVTNAGTEWPTPVRFALVGLLATRARHAAATLDDRSAASDSLTRLDAHRRAHGLAAVVALKLDQPPELGSWYQDALHWWRALEDAVDGD